MFGFVLVGLGLVCGVAAFRRQEHRRRRRLLIGVLSLASVLMLVDYLAVFLPLYEIVSHPGSARDEQFLRLHQASRWVNFADVALCTVAAIVVCWPTREE